MVDPAGRGGPSLSGNTEMDLLKGDETENPCGAYMGLHPHRLLDSGTQRLTATWT